MERVERFNQLRGKLEIQFSSQEMRVRSVCRDDPLEEGMAAHSSILAWRIPCTEKPSGLQSIELQRVGHD